VSAAKVPDCSGARSAIETCRFTGWRGLPGDCAPQRLFDLPDDAQWGEQRLGARFEPTGSRLLDLANYYRPMVHVRDGRVVLFEGMNPVLVDGWDTLAHDLGEPEAAFDWEHGAIPMPAGERVHAARGITIFLNPDNAFVIHVALYVPTTVSDYSARLRPHYRRTHQ
jgi:hypothetical protein